MIPIAVTRTYRQRDTQIRPFGVGTTFPYAMFLWSVSNYTQADLVLPDGGTVHYVRTSPGTTTYLDAVFTHQETQTTAATPSTFYKSTLIYNGTGWDLRVQDGTVYVFGDNAPLQAIRDRFGNTLTITHAGSLNGPTSRITSPNGRWVELTYTVGRIDATYDDAPENWVLGWQASGSLRRRGRNAGRESRVR